MLEVVTVPWSSEKVAGSWMLRAPRLVVSIHAWRASSTHRAMARTPSPWVWTWRALSESARRAAVGTKRTLPCWRPQAGRPRWPASGPAHAIRGIPQAGREKGATRPGLRAHDLDTAG